MPGRRLTAENIPKLYTEEEAAILLTIQKIFDFLPDRDYKKVKPTYYPQAATARLRPEGMLFAPLSDLLDQLKLTPMKIEEYMYDPMVKVANGNLAMVWTPCKILVDGKLASEAVNCIVLHKEDGVWRMSSIADTATATIVPT